jgi:low affinity Fe/Cu permease
MFDASVFNRLAKSASRIAGKPMTFGLAAASILIWAVSGPLFGFSDTWQLLVNTATTVITFLMVFLIQNSQNRESEATQIKLDELIRAMKGAENALLDLEEMTLEDLDKIRKKYEDLAKQARKELRSRKFRPGENDLISDGAKPAGASKSRRVRSSPRRRTLQSQGANNGK